jgi:hypothetical protein
MPNSATILRKALAIALILLMQGPAMLVQEVAWVKMLVSYTQERGWMRGVVETFDGNHPCELCHKASEIRNEEGKTDPSERPGEGMRFRLCWAEMIPVGLLVLPAMPEHECMAAGNPWRETARTRAADAPPLPPPEWV